MSQFHQICEPGLNFYDHEPQSLIRIRIHFTWESEDPIAFDTRLPPEQTACINNLVQYLNEQLGEMRRRYRIHANNMLVTWRGETYADILDTLDQVWCCGARASLLVKAVPDPNGEAAYNIAQPHSEEWYSRDDGTQYLINSSSLSVTVRMPGTQDGRIKVSLPPNDQRQVYHQNASGGPDALSGGKGGDEPDEYKDWEVEDGPGVGPHVPLPDLVDGSSNRRRSLGTKSWPLLAHDSRGGYDAGLLKSTWI